MMDLRSWRASKELTKDLCPSTSKESVLPRSRSADSSDSGYRFGYDNRIASERLKKFERLEKLHQPSCKYFETVQTEINVHMRQIVVQWMYEVCEEETCSCETFVLAVSYLDRFLSVQTVHKAQLQALGAACLFLAGKVKEPQPFQASRLEKYTDESVSVSDLLAWELLVLGRLNWDLASLTPFDFLDQYLSSWFISKKENRQRMNRLVAILVMDFASATQLPSEIAAKACQLLTGKQSQEFISPSKRPYHYDGDFSFEFLEPSKKRPLESISSN